jgi:HK97 family phage prohead protease
VNGELTIDGTPEHPTIRGYAVHFGEGYMVGASSGAFVERVARGAFKRTLASRPDVLLEAEGNGIGVMARTTSGTLRLREDGRGLRFEADLDPSDIDAQRAIVKVRRGDLTETGYASRTIDDAWNDGKTQRTLRAVSLSRGHVALLGRGAEPASSGARKRASRSTIEQRAAAARRIGNRCGDLALRAAGGASGSRRTSSSGRDRLELAAAKAKRTMLRRSAERAYTHGSDPTPLGKYTAAEVEQLGKEGKALEKGDGTFWFPLKMASDVANCVAAYRELNPKAREGVYRWITLRCRALKLEYLLPKGWGEYSGKLHPNEYV